MRLLQVVRIRTTRKSSQRFVDSWFSGLSRSPLNENRWKFKYCFNLYLNLFGTKIAPPLGWYNTSVLSRASRFSYRLQKNHPCEFPTCRSHVISNASVFGSPPVTSIIKLMWSRERSHCKFGFRHIYSRFFDVYTARLR